MGTEQESKLATEKMNGAELDGRKLTVNEARAREDSGGRPFGPDRRAGAFQARNKRRY
jgi:RNA recognition motif-containing protein